MTDSKPGLYTFHKVREQCERADAEAWRAFLTLYGPLCQHLLAMYAPNSAGAADALARMLTSFTANNFERFRVTARQTEREFLADLRTLLLETITPGSDPIAPDADSNLNPERLAKLLEGLPLLHQEMIFFKLAGYSDGSIEMMLRVAPSVAEKSFQRLLPDYAAAANIQRDRSPWPAEWLLLLQQARTAKKENCPELHQILRIHDGQVSWYDKEPVEKHVSGCLCCLDRWTALREVGHWRRVAPPLRPEQVEEGLKAVPVNSVPRAKKSLLQRMFGG